MKKFKKKNYFLSLQTKQALVYAMLEAKKNKSALITTKFIFYGLIKTNPSLLTHIINNLYKKSNPFSKNSKIILSRCEMYLRIKINENKINLFSSKVSLSKSVRNLFYSLFRDLKYKNKKYNIITTFSIFTALLKNKSIKNWLINEIFF